MTADPRPAVLYACVHNSGRSVAALALTRAHAGDRVDVRSAGSDPDSGVHPAVAQVLAERDLDVANHVPAPLTPDRVAQADIVVTIGCGETCPVFPGTRYQDWPVDDPAGQDLPAVRRIVDEIDLRVRGLLAELDVDVR